MDFKKAIEKLNSIDAKELKNINFSKLREIDVATIKQELIERPDLAINLVLICLTLGVAVYSFTSYKNLSKSYAAEIIELKKKLEVLEEKNKNQSIYDQFIKSFPENIPKDLMIGQLSDLATRSNIRIISVSPANSKEDEFMKLTSVNLQVEAKTYEDLILFMFDIEHSLYSLRIDKWSNKHKSQVFNPGEMNNAIEEQNQTEIDIEVILEIGSIELKNA